jgi:hypothetical protein
MAGELSPMQAEHQSQVRERAEQAKKLISHQAVVEWGRKLPRPIPARCTALAYDGTMVTVVGEVTHIAGPWRWFVADYPEWGTWVAVVHVDTCEYLDR